MIKRTFDVTYDGPYGRQTTRVTARSFPLAKANFRSGTIVWIQEQEQKKEIK
jgi:hypothetical protein